MGMPTELLRVQLRLEKINAALAACPRHSTTNLPTQPTKKRPGLLRSPAVVLHQTLRTKLTCRSRSSNHRSCCHRCCSSYCTALRSASEPCGKPSLRPLPSPCAERTRCRSRSSSPACTPCGTPCTCES